SRARRPGHAALSRYRPGHRTQAGRRPVHPKGTHDPDLPHYGSPAVRDDHDLKQVTEVCWRQGALGAFRIIEASHLDAALKLAADGSKARRRKVAARPFLGKRVINVVARCRWPGRGRATAASARSQNGSDESEGA